MTVLVTVNDVPALVKKGSSYLTTEEGMVHGPEDPQYLEAGEGVDDFEVACSWVDDHTQHGAEGFSIEVSGRTREHEGDHSMNEYTTTLTDGTVLIGEVQGDGGVCSTDSRLAWVLRTRLNEEVNGHPQVFQKHQGNVSVWTDPNNVDCAKRLTTVKASQIREIRNEAGTVYTRA